MTKQLIILLITLWLSNGGESLQKDVSQPKTNQMIRMNQDVSEALDLSNEMMGPFPLDLNNDELEVDFEAGIEAEDRAKRDKKKAKKRAKKYKKIIKGKKRRQTRTTFYHF